MNLVPSFISLYVFSSHQRLIHVTRNCAPSLPILLGPAVTPQSSDLGHRLQQVLQEQLPDHRCWY